MLLRSAGILSILTAFVAGYWGAQAMFTFVPDSAFFWLPMVTFGAPILLLVGAILILFPNLGKTWFLAFVSMILIAFWVVFVRENLNAYWVFSGIVLLLTWSSVTLATAIRKRATIGFGASIILLLVWLRPFIKILSSPGVSALGANLAFIGLWVLLIATTVLLGIATVRPRL